LSYKPRKEEIVAMVNPKTAALSVGAWKLDHSNE
jgi:hypothetical protein